VTRRLGGASRRDPPRAARFVARTAASRVAHPSRSGVLRPRRSRRASGARPRTRVGRVTSRRVAVVEKIASLERLARIFDARGVRPSPAQSQIRRGPHVARTRAGADRTGSDAAARRGRSRGRVGASARPPATTRTARRFRVRNTFERAEIFWRLVTLVHRLFSRDKKFFDGVGFLLAPVSKNRDSSRSPLLLSRPLSVPGTAPDRR
jgi:hypothetical protein